MDNKEAIELLKQIKSILLNSNSWLESTHNPITEGFDLAIESLQKKKRTAKVLKGQIYYTDNGDKIIDSTWVCGNCKHKVYNFTEEYIYCPQCGSKLLWN